MCTYTSKAFQVLFVCSCSPRNRRGYIKCQLLHQPPFASQGSVAPRPSEYKSNRPQNLPNKNVNLDHNLRNFLFKLPYSLPVFLSECLCVSCALVCTSLSLILLLVYISWGLLLLSLYPDNGWKISWVPGFSSQFTTTRYITLLNRHWLGEFRKYLIISLETKYYVYILLISYLVSGNLYQVYEILIWKSRNAYINFNYKNTTSVNILVYVMYSITVLFKIFSL